MANYLRVDEAADYLKVSKSRMYHLVNEINHYKLGHTLVFEKTDLDVWMQSKLIRADSFLPYGRIDIDNLRRKPSGLITKRNRRGRNETIRVGTISDSEN